MSCDCNPKQEIGLPKDIPTKVLDKISAENHIKQILADSLKKDEHVIILADIDNFQGVTDCLGQEFGKHLSRDIGNCLRKIIRNGDVIGQIDSETFIIFLRNTSHFTTIKRKIEEISFAFRRSIMLEGKPVLLSCSLGVSCFTQTDITPISYTDLYNQADSAVKIAKSEGGGQCSIYSNLALHNNAMDSLSDEIRYFNQSYKKNILLEAFKMLQSTSDITVAIQEILELIGKEFGVSRSYIFELTDDGKHYCNTYEWCAPGVISQQAYLQNIPLDQYTYIFALINEYGILSCEDIDTFDGDYFELHKEQGVKSFLQGIVKEDNASRLLLGVDECVKKRNWTEREVSGILHLANLLGMFSNQLENHNLLLGYNKLKSSITTDRLTGIPTKEKFYSDTNDRIKSNPDKQFLFILFNINKFQMINTFYGVDEGDRLLKRLATSLAMACTETQATCGRVGADIFCVCVEYTSSAEHRLDQLIARIDSTILSYKLEYSVTVSVGVFEIIDTDMPIELMYSKAYTATKKVKNTQITAYAIYSENMEFHEIYEQSIINNLDSAIAEKQFMVYLQPKILLKTEDIIGAEALIRWQHPEKGFMSPAEFIPIFEKSGLISKVDYFVLDSVFAYLKKQIDNQAKIVPISVNLSRVDLFNVNIIPWFIGLLEKYNINPQYVHIEITESAYTENYEKIIIVIKELKRLGFHIEMDDFGTGYSSLNMFNDMIVDTLKLDMNFLRNLQANTDKVKILSFIISLAKHFSLPVVAEGIETDEQMIFLRDIGCEIGQGYYFARPMPLADFTDYLAAKEQEVETNKYIPQMLELTEILYPNEQVDNFFSNALNATGIFAVTGHEIKLVRCNDDYYDMLNIQNHKSIFKERIKDVFHKEDLNKVFGKIITAKTTRRTTLCQVRILDFNLTNNEESPQYQNIIILFKLINSSDQTDFYLATIHNLDKD